MKKRERAAEGLKIWLKMQFWVQATLLTITVALATPTIFQELGPDAMFSTFNQFIIGGMYLYFFYTLSYLIISGLFFIIFYTYLSVTENRIYIYSVVSFFALFLFPLTFPWVLLIATSEGGRLVSIPAGVLSLVVPIWLIKTKRLIVQPRQ